MKKINGIVCVADIRNEIAGEVWQHIYGKNKHLPKNRHYENFETNGLSPFESDSEARIGYAQLQIKQKDILAQLRTIELQIAETEDEVLSLLTAPSIVVITNHTKGEDAQKLLLGPYVKGRSALASMPAPNALGMMLKGNGMKPFDSLDGAVFELMRELGRQGRIPSTAATFKLEPYA